MKNMNKLSSAARFVLAMLMVCIGLSSIVMPQVALADIIKQTAKVDVFTKTAKRDCDKITYTIEVKTLSNGAFPDTITIADNWPAGLIPASAVQFSSTPAVAASTTLTPTGWATTFNTPVGPGGQPVLSSYVITFTSTIDPAALNGGDFKLSNQAILTIKSLPTLKYKSDDPSTAVQGDATTILIPVAEVKKCLGTTTGDNGPTKSCLKGDAVVTCGKVAGTFDVTLNLGGSGGVIPTTAQISVLTPGVTIVSPASSYPVIGGKVKLTLAGATPGQVIDFQMDGSSTTPDPQTGLSICCNGKISITIPKGLKCNPPKPTIDITKICDLAQHVWIGDLPPKPNMPANGYVAMCHIKVTTTGNIPNPISLSEVMSGTGTVKYMGATDPWACVPPMVPGNTPMNCTLPGNTMTGPSDTSIIDVKVTFTNAGDVKEAKNCAAATYDGVQTKKACDDFQIGEGTIKVEKKCSPAVYGKYPVGPAATGLGFHADCQITVTTTGPQMGAITVGDNLIGSGTVLNMNAPAPWACTTPNCTVNGAALNQTSSTTVISATAVFTSAGNAMEAKNCAEVKVAGKAAGESCTGITVAEKAKITVLKEALYNGQHITSQSFPIVLTCGGVATNGTVSDGTPYVQTGLPVNTACSVVEPITAPAAGLCDKGQVGSWNTSYNPTTPVAATVAGGVITITNKLECKPIVDQIDDQLYVKKVVVNHAPGSVDGLQFWIEDFCNSNQNHGQAFLKDGDVTHYKHYEAGVSCQIKETIIPATTACGKGMNPKWTTTYAPSQTIALQPNGETVTVTNTLDCERIGNPIDSDMYIKKIVVNNAPGSVAGMVFDILSQCTNTTQPTGFAHFTDGQTIVFHHYEAGMSCNLSETIPATTACGKDTPVWTTTYAPSQTVALSPNGETITVTNTLNCEPIGENGLSTFSVSKEASYDGQPILGTPFQMNVTCDNGNAQSLNVLSGQSQTISNLPIGTSCNVVEGKIGTTNLCPKGTVEKWATTYTPTNGTNTTAANSSVVVRVNNELTCEPTVTPVETGTFTLNKIALFNGEHITNQTFNVNLTCGNNAQQVQVADGVPYVKTDIPVGTDCDVSETPAPVPALCPQGQTGSWKTTYAPNEGVTVPATGATITITNRLVCETVLTPNCLPGTFWNGNICIPNCPPLTNWNGSICAPTCPPLTEWDGSVCRPTCPPLTEWNGSICAPTCPPLTEWNGSICAPTCPPLTAWNGSICAPTCPPLTEWNGSICAPTCPPLTEWDGSVCRPTCPPLTTWDGSFCKPDCPPLTQWNGTICVPHLFKVVEPTVETCKDGFTLKAGKGCVPEVVAPKCDGITAQPGKDGSCVCLYRNMSKTSSASCGCGKGSKFIKGKGCVPIEPVCKNGTKFNTARGRCEPLCHNNQTYNVKTNRCDTAPPVCKRNEKFNPKTGKCVAVSNDPVCRSPYKYNAKIDKCVQVIKPAGRSCPFPLVPTPLGCVDPGAVIDLFNGGGGRPKNDGGGDPGPIGDGKSAYCKQNPDRCP
jgi:Domain of unknown function (DUF5979)